MSLQTVPKWKVEWKYSPLDIQSNIVMYIHANHISEVTDWFNSINHENKTIVWLSIFKEVEVSQSYVDSF